MQADALPSKPPGKPNGRDFEQTPGDGEGQGSLACCSPWGHKESDTTERLNISNKSQRKLAKLELSAESNHLSLGPQWLLGLAGEIASGGFRLALLGHFGEILRGCRCEG